MKIDDAYHGKVIILISTVTVTVSLHIPHDIFPHKYLLGYNFVTKEQNGINVGVFRFYISIAVL